MSFCEHMRTLILLNWILLCLQVGKIQVIAFQSQGGQYRSPLPLAMVPVPVIDLESSRSSSDHSAFEGIELDTGDSRASKNSKV